MHVLLQQQCKLCWIGMYLTAGILFCTWCIVALAFCLPPGLLMGCWLFWTSHLAGCLVARWYGCACKACVPCVCQVWLCAKADCDLYADLGHEAATHQLASHLNVQKPTHQVHHQLQRAVPLELLPCYPVGLRLLGQVLAP